MKLQPILDIIDQVLGLFCRTSSKEEQLKKVTKKLEKVKIERKKKEDLDRAVAEASRAKIEAIKAMRDDKERRKALAEYDRERGKKDDL